MRPFPLLHGAVGDIYPEAVQLKKGECVIRVMLRHDDAALLEKLKVCPPSRWPSAFPCFSLLSSAVLLQLCTCWLYLTCSDSSRRARSAPAAASARLTQPEAHVKPPA